MKTKEFLFKLLWNVVFLMIVTNVHSQCKVIRIDGQYIVNPKLPTWLKAGQTLETAGCIESISVLEFTVTGTNMDFVQVIDITPSSSNTMVPTGKIWKVESIHPSLNIDNTLSWAYTSPGTQTFVPFVSGLYRIQVWGGGGSGAANASGPGTVTAVGGGGGGGYCEKIVYLTKGTVYSVSVGNGGNKVSSGNGQNGQASSFTGPGINLVANGGQGGNYSGANSLGGCGSGGDINLCGENGTTLKGGDAPNKPEGGGEGGAGGIAGSNGNIIGGGGGGSSSNCWNCGWGSLGARGEVRIIFYGDN